jgi:hypothetical protein
MMRKEKTGFIVILVLSMTAIAAVSAQSRTPKWDKLVRDYVAVANSAASLAQRVERNPEGISKRELYSLQDRADKISIEAQYSSTWNEEPTEDHTQKVLDATKRIQLAFQKIQRYAERMPD